MMALVNPSLFSALGKGFASDAYAVDGTHLRWQFDPRLGFPRHAFCVEQRGSVTTGRTPPDGGERFADLRLDVGSTPITVTRFTESGLHVERRPQPMLRTDRGVELDGQPIELRFVEADGHACWVRLRLTLMSRGAAAVVEAWYDNRGHRELVDRDARSTGRPPTRFDDIVTVPDRLERVRRTLAELLDRPDVTPSGQPIAAALLPLHRRLVALDPGRFRRVSGEWLKQVHAALVELKVTPDQLAPDLSVPVSVVLEVSSARIDRLTINGSAAALHDLRWVRSESLAADKGWKPVGCFPAATGEDDYQARNEDLFAGVPAAGVAKERIVGGGPVGAEPLDEPVVPPTRPATDVERARRYLDPWLDRLEPWLATVLAGSLGGAVHQGEIELAAELDDAGQVRGAGVPARLAAQRAPLMRMRPYPVLLAAGLAGFPTARLLGLGCVLVDTTERPMDYRVRGRWLVEDLWAWVGAESRRLAELADRAVKASPADYARLQAEVLAAQMSLVETTGFVGDLTATAVDGVVELVALVIGVRVAPHPLFAAPATVTVREDGLGLPPAHARQAVAAVEWALRQRARVMDDTAVPTGACIARSPGGTTGLFDSVRNPNDPADPASPQVAVLPAGPSGAPGAAGTALFADRYVDDGVDYRYGVSECDPFGRWSTFTETAFRWDDLTPPAPPVQVQASLAEGGTPARQVLTITFAWPATAGSAATTTYDLHLRRVAPPSASAQDPTHWGRFERAAGTSAAPLTFAGDFTGVTVHDGMSVAVSFADEDRPSPSGPAAYRVFTVAAEGVLVPHDANDRARAWVAVGSRNARGIASESLGGPALAEDFRIAPPPPPVFPPDPVLATYPDADRTSSFTLSWPVAGQVRSTVYRAGERDLVAMARLRGIAVAWNESDPPAVRSAAVRAVAPSLRDAFEPVSGMLPAGVGSYTDILPGGLKTLSVYTIVGQSPALVPGPWPSSDAGFVAVAVPKVPEPSPPVVVSALHSLANGSGVQLAIAEPPRGSADVGSYEVYRVFAERFELAAEIRTMRPSGRVAVTAASYVERPAGPPKVATIVDSDGLKPWRAYLYRVVARGAAPGRETRSAPSGAARVIVADPNPPPAPQVVSATRTGSDVVVTWEAVAPTTPAGRWRFAVVDTDGPITLGTLDAEDPGVRDPANPDRFTATLVGATVTEVTVIVTDPLGRTATSAPAPVA